MWGVLFNPKEVSACMIIHLLSFFLNILSLQFTIIGIKKEKKEIVIATFTRKIRNKIKLQDLKPIMISGHRKLIHIALRSLHK